MIESTLTFIKSLSFKIISWNIYFSHIKQFYNFLFKKIIKNINNEFIVNLIKNYYLFI